MRNVIYRGRVYSVAELSRETGIPSGTLWNRIFGKGMTIEDAVNMPVNEARRRARFGKRTRSKKQSCETYPDCFHCPYPDCWVFGTFPGELREVNKARPEPYVSAFDHVYPLNLRTNR